MCPPLWSQFGHGCRQVSRGCICDRVSSKLRPGPSGGGVAVASQSVETKMAGRQKTSRQRVGKKGRAEEEEARGYPSRPEASLEERGRSSLPLKPHISPRLMFTAIVMVVGCLSPSLFYRRQQPARRQAAFRGDKSRPDRTHGGPSS